jgi:diaminohydroxyphosphoribosylaminopyrimidine deaminase/5-amino-6-(5-phosphoribosylamino)uracil reductase
MLRAAGLEVVTEIGHAQAYRDHIGHILRVTKNRPLVTLKLAQTQDGFAAGDRHDRRLMITGQHANGFVHMLRAQHDGIMVGIGTVRADDPLLTVRLEGVEHRPLRIVLDPHLSLSDRSRLVATASQCPTLVFCAGGADAKTMRHLISLGVDVAEVAQGRDGGLDLAEVLRQLAGRGITRLFSEGGPSVAQSLLRAGLADDVLILTGPKALAHEGVPALGAAGRSILADPLRYTSGPAQWLGDDRLEHYWSVDVYGSD